MKKLFGGINLTYPKLIIFALIAAVYTAVLAIIPVTRDTSFRDISISFEVWILFGIIIIMNSKSPVDSAIKCFLFFLISQPLIYLIQVPFSDMGWNIFIYYKYWFIWTLLTIPMGFIGHYMKKDKMWGLAILFPILILLAYHYIGFLCETLTFFPYHIISTVFCLVTLILYPIVIFNDPKIKKVGLIISIVIILASSAYVFIKGDSSYKTSLMSNGYTIDETGEVINFDDTYKVYLKDKSYGELSIGYEDALEDYIINADFRKIGKTEFTIEAPDGTKKVFTIDIKRDTYSFKKKK